MATTRLPRTLGLLLMLLGTGAAFAAGPAISRVEPPNWWTGLQDKRLQLMVYGPGVARARVTVGAPGLHLQGTHRLDSDNHLFVDLQVNAGPGDHQVPLHFDTAGGRSTVVYALQAREPGSAQRRGFDSRDAILNLVPDRFANGDPSNDNQPGFADHARREDKDAARHGGDLRGLTATLDYIAGMGYTMIWPTPLTENRQPAYSYHGYASTDSYRIDPRFGSLADYRQFVAEARRRGLGVLMDFVPNHIGSGHHWMQDLPSRDWINHGARFVPTTHARTAVSDRYASKADVAAYDQGWFVDTMPDPDQRRPELATHQIQNAIWWIEGSGLAGLRIDTYGYADKAFLARLTGRLMQEYPQLGIVAEEWSPNPLVVAYWLRGRHNPDGYVSHLPSVMDYPLHEVMRSALTEPESLHSGLRRLYEALVNDNLYPEPQRLVLFEGNHDVPRLYSAMGEDVALWRMALAYLLTMPRTPQLYYGTELLMTSPTVRDDGAFRQDFPGGWPGDPVDALSGRGLSPAQQEAQAFLRRLLNWRRTATVVHSGGLRHFVPEDGTYVYFRHDATSRVMVVLNKAMQTRRLDSRRFAEMLAPDTRGTDVISGRRLDVGTHIEVPPRTALVVALDGPPPAAAAR